MLSQRIRKHHECEYKMGDQRSNLFKQMTLIMLVCLSVTGCSVDKNLDFASAQESPFIDKKGISQSHRSASQHHRQPPRHDFLNAKTILSSPIAADIAIRAPDLLYSWRGLTKG